MTDPAVPLSEYASRRQRILSVIKKGVAVVFSGEMQGEDFHVHPNFEYLTGISDEPGAALLLDGGARGARRELLFLKPRDPEVERWDGLRLSVGAELRKSTGFKTIFRTPAMGRFLNEAIVRAKRCLCLQEFSQFDQPVSKDLELFRKVAERVPGVAIEDQTELLKKLRSVKSAAEIKMMQRAVDLTAKGYEQVVEQLRPGLLESDVQEILEHAYKTNGSKRGAGYGSIVGGGLMATVLHYRANSKELRAGDLVCIDSAGTFGAYTADITRTYPVGGKFNKRQREIYDIVLKAEEAAIRAVKPGVSFAKLHEVSYKIIDKAGYGEYFIHGIGHHLGIEVHDVTPSGNLQVGAVLTIEPGIYLPDENLGVRIEDDIVVTKTGYRNLSAKIPKKAVQIEKLMAGRPKTRARKKRPRA